MFGLTVTFGLTGGTLGVLREVDDNERLRLKLGAAGWPIRAICDIGPVIGGVVIERIMTA